MFKIGAFTVSVRELSESDFAELERIVKEERLRRGDARELDITEKCLIRCGQHVKAIKAYRDRTGLTLREAKDVCDNFRFKIPGYTTGMVYNDETMIWEYPNSRW